MRIIIGLGNKDEKYSQTRHNAGFMAVDALARELGLAWETNKKFNALVAKMPDLLLVKPQNYMNNSGESAQAILNFYKISPTDASLPDILTVVHDDLDIGLGKIKISADSRSAGHNGVQSIIDRIGTKNFKRVRIGIKTEMASVVPTEKFVLEKFRKEEMEIIKKLLPEITKQIKIALI